MKRLIRFLYSTKFLLIAAFVLNVAIYVVFSLYVSKWAYEGLLLVGLIFGILLIGKTHENLFYKVLWFFLIVLFPLFGVLLYFQHKTNRGTKGQRKVWQSITYNSTKYLEQNADIVESLQKSDVSYANVNKYLLNQSNMPVYQNSQSSYIASGEQYFKELFGHLKEAKNFIFLEYFVIKPGKVWDELFEILRLKAREGVDIRLIYDDFGCINSFPDKKLFQKLAHHKINAVPFNKIQAGFSLFVNYRDHRKVAIVDGKVAFVGGVNIGDEYANLTGSEVYWKDSAIKISGPAVWNAMVMFFNSWALSSKEEIDVANYVPVFNELVPVKNKEFLQPFGTGPLTLEPVARNLYLKMINTAKHSVVITTPYFILDNQMQQSLKLAAASGVEVKIIMPSNSAHKWSFYLSRAYYEGLIKAGIYIYEYTPGYMHSKMMLIDNEQSIVGTTNFDFRSIYLHFDNGVVISNSKTINSIKFDIDSVINSSHLISLRDLKQRKWYEKLFSQVLRVFAPLV